MSHPERDIIDSTQEFSRPVEQLWDISDDLSYYLRTDTDVVGDVRKVVYRAMQFAFQITEKDVVAPVRHASTDRLYAYLGDEALVRGDILAATDLYFDEHPIDDKIIKSFTPDLDETGCYGEHARVAAGLMCIMIEAEEYETRSAVERARKKGVVALLGE